MSRYRYQILDAPAGANVAAFCPLPTVNPVASSFGTVHVSGSPGTRPVPSPHPAATPDPSFDPLTVSSAVSPDLIFPAIYTVDGPQERPPVPIRHHNNMPVPAVNPQRVPLPAFKRPVLRGRRQIPWPRVFQRWPSAVTIPPGGSSG